MGLSISNGLLYILKELKLKWYLEHSKSQWTLLIIIIIIIIIITTIILSTINAWKQKSAKKRSKASTFIF